MNKILLFIFLSSFSFSLFGAIEIGANAGYDRLLYGENRDSKIIDRTYSAFLAWYMFSTTALEFNFTYNENVNVQNASFKDGTDTIGVSSIDTVENKVWGVGLRQALYGNNSRIQPMVSLGYAKQFVDQKKDIIYSVNGQQQLIEPYSNYSARSDNVFAAFTLKIYLWKGLSLNGSVKTVFRAFEFDEAQYNLKYLAGFSWVF